MDSVKVLLDTLQTNYVGRVEYNETTNVAKLEDGTRIYLLWDNVINWIKAGIEHGK